MLMQLHTGLRKDYNAILLLQLHPDLRVFLSPGRTDYNAILLMLLHPDLKEYFCHPDVTYHSVILLMQLHPALRVFLSPGCN